MEVFESDDVVVHEDSIPAVSLHHSDDVIEDSIMPERAFECFMGKKYDANAYDFSDSIAQRTVRVREYELGSRSKVESLSERYNRLVSECEAFEQDVKALEKEKGLERLIAPGEVIKDLGAVIQRLKSAGSGEGSGAVDGILKKLKSNSTGAKQQATSDQFVYEVYCPAGEEGAVPVSRLVELETRLAALEASRAASGAGNAGRSVHEELADLRAKLRLVDPKNIDQLDRKIRMLTVSMDGYVDRVKKTASTSGAASSAGQAAATTTTTTTQQQQQGMVTKESAEKIEYLFGTLKQHEAMLSLLPVVVERLKVLKYLHEKGVKFVTSLNEITSAQDKIAKDLAGNKALIDKLNENMKTNNAIVLENIEMIRAKMDKLK